MIRVKQSNKNWKQINFRTTNTLLAAEFLHDLYNRHFPDVNSIRFRNSIVTKKGTDTYSYAPETEWDSLAQWYGWRFIKGRGDVYKGLDDLLNFDKPVLKSLIKRLKATDFTKAEDIDLALDLIDLHYISLGEIYRVNLVQIEHALNYAILEGLKSFFADPSIRADALSTLVFSADPTVAKIEEDEFVTLVIDNFNQPALKNELIEKHFNKYSFTHSAYGASGYTLEAYIQKYDDLVNIGLDKLIEKQNIEKESFASSKEKRDRLFETISQDKILVKNISYMSRIGVLRDKNKALMGTTNEWREKIMTEILKRTNVTSEDLSWYLLQEIALLIVERKKVDPIEIGKRKHGVVFVRQEHLEYSYTEAVSMVHPPSNSSVLTGVCASSGEASGKVCIIRNSSDINKMIHGDIMVSPGTDFDLINAMQMAGAIITEEGGLLSHASVVSRELKLPCVIGVSGATEMLKDGDIVKVDAASGIISIIK